jgi:hypothetical protein
MSGLPTNRQLPTTASTSISTSQRGSRNPWTTMKPVAGRILPKASPCTCATASPWAASTRNTRVRTTSPSVAPDSRRASSMISRHRRACTPTSGSTWPSGQIAAVAETKTRFSWRTARLKPMVGSNGELELMCCRTPCRLRGAHRSPSCCSRVSSTRITSWWLPLRHERRRPGAPSLAHGTDEDQACKCAPFRKRLKGFEPSTFCMASSSYGTEHRKEPPANARI